MKKIQNKKLAVIGDVHLGATVFAPYISNTLEYIIPELHTYLFEGDTVLWLGDMISSWKFIRNDNNLTLLTSIMANKDNLGIFNHIILKGNHDILPKTGKSALGYLNELPNVKIINEPTEFLPEVLLVPHNYNGYILTKPYDYVFAHLALYGQTINESNTKYTKEDVISWIPKGKPNNIYLGHIHTPSIIEHKDDPYIEIVGSIAPVSWGEVYDTPPVRQVNIFNIKDSTIEFDFNFPIKTIYIKKESSTLTRTIIHPDTGDLFTEEYEQKVSAPKTRTKGETIDEIITTVCKEQGIKPKAVKLFLRGLGIR